MPQPERLPDPQPRLGQQHDQEPVPQAGAGVDQAPDLAGGHRGRRLGRRGDADRAIGVRPRSVAPGMHQQRHVPAHRPWPSQLPQQGQHGLVPSGVEPIEPSNRSPLPDQRRVANRGRCAGKPVHAGLPSWARSLKPSEELREFLQAQAPEVSAALAGPLEEVPQVVRVCLHGVRRASRRGEMTQVHIRRLDRQTAVIDDGVRHPIRIRNPHPLHSHSSLPRVDDMTASGVHDGHSTLPTPTTKTSKTARSELVIITGYRGLLLIHAAKLPDEEALREVPRDTRHLDQRGVVLGVATLAGSHTEQSCRGGCSAWAQPGRAHWELAHVAPLHRPVAARGALYLWQPDTELRAAVADALQSEGSR